MIINRRLKHEKKLILLVVCSSLILSSCSGSGKGDNVICTVHNENDDLSRCEDGQLLFFYQFGGELVVYHLK
jgi:hypothetical protein